MLPFFLKTGMELVCEKYKEQVAAAGARCRRPTEYCKFRPACLIHFLSRETGAGEAAEASPQAAPTKEKTSDDHSAF